MREKGTTCHTRQTARARRAAVHLVCAQRHPQPLQQPPRSTIACSTYQRVVEALVGNIAHGRRSRRHGSARRQREAPPTFCRRSSASRRHDTYLLYTTSARISCGSSDAAVAVNAQCSSHDVSCSPTRHEEPQSPLSWSLGASNSDQFNYYKLIQILQNFVVRKC